MAGTVDELLADRGPEAAQQALRAAAEIRVWNGRATAWLVVQRLLEVAGFAMVLAGVVAIVLGSVGVLGSAVQSSSGGSVVIGWAVVAACYLLAPVVRWLWSLHRPQDTTTWPDGAQAYAVLAVLARVRCMHPDRLATLTGLPRERCDEWVAACAVRGLAVRAGRRRGLLRNAEITAAGLARLDAWTAELSARAASAQPCTDSTAPTSPAVSSERSASDVT